MYMVIKCYFIVFYSIAELSHKPHLQGLTFVSRSRMVAKADAAFMDGNTADHTDSSKEYPHTGAKLENIRSVVW